MSVGLFDVLGPITVGPSSSHTAGAVRIGQVCRELLGSDVKRAEITFYGSFAETYRGHGTDKAVVGGLLGFDTFNEQIRDSLTLAPLRGMEISIAVSDALTPHPNTVHIKAWSRDSEISVSGISIGGGVIRITEIEGQKVNVSCSSDTLIVFNRDLAGVVAAVSGLLAGKNINIATLSLCRARRGTDAIMVIEVDQHIAERTCEELQALPNVQKVIFLPKL
ncbi:MAG: L-serine ammonia-lyase, iron-sulfur-dependent subunit beta [Clostridia bacterium]|nr:L-serine ammonia-lyase, iron-sulfur-dependent subunit beta [Clostridia bacterium]